MKSNIKNILFIGLILLLSCRKEDQEEVILASPVDYYPLKIGSEFVYEVDSIYYDDFDQTVDTFLFQVKEIYTDTFTDLSGNLTYRLERYKRFKVDSLDFNETSWGNPRIWSVSLSGQNIHRIEENVRFVNLIHPIKEGSSWNGNAFNNKGAWDYTYTDLNQPHENFDSTVTVIQRDNPPNLLEKQYYEQKFAKNVGLIYYHFIDVYSQNTQSGLPLMDRIEQGVQYSQKLIEYSIPE